MSTDWRKQLSFADRLSATSKMQVSLLSETIECSCSQFCSTKTRLTGRVDRAAAYKQANPDCTSAEASDHAKASETTIRQDALNIDEYQDLISKTLQLLQSSAAPPGPVEDHHINSHIFPNLPTSGARIGRYENAQHFKDGLFSEVFKATIPDEARKAEDPILVALKITTPEMMVAPHDSAREARILTAARGENVIPLIETFEQAGGRLVLAFPYMPYDLQGLLQQQSQQQQKILNPETQKTILRDLFSALSHLHNQQILHRDIKPSNILLATPTGPAYLADFGIAWSASDAASEPADQKILDVGTTCYRPPELLFGGQAYGSGVDMWAAGCVAAQVVSLGNRTLFDAGDLGSELALIRSLFETLGTPDLASWPEASSLPDWGKMRFTQYPARPWMEILPDTDAAAVDLVKSLVVYESSRRFSASEALRHAFLQ